MVIAWQIVLLAPQRLEDAFRVKHLLTRRKKESGGWRPYRLNRGLSALSGSYANRFLDWNNEHPAIVDLSGARLTYNGLNRAPHPTIGDDDFKLQLWKKIAEIFTTSRNGSVIRLPTQHFNFADGHAFDADLDQGFLYLLHFERFDDCLDLFHDPVMLKHTLVSRNRS